jgi:hypothetical protein
MPYARNDTARRGEIGEFAGLGRGVGEWFLAKNVFACEKRCLRHLVVQTVRQTDIDQVNLGIVYSDLPILADSCAWSARC